MKFKDLDEWDVFKFIPDGTIEWVKVSSRLMVARTVGGFMDLIDSEEIEEAHEADVIKIGWMSFSSQIIDTTNLKEIKEP